MIPDRTKAEFLRGNLSPQTAVVRCALLKNTTEYSPDSVNHEFVADVLDAGTTGEECDDTNYARQDVANVTVNEDNTDNEGEIVADNVTFPSLGGSQTIEAVLFYIQIGGDDTTPADDPILRIIDDSETAELEKATNGDDFTVEIPTEGLINFT